ncbi:MAG: right-handed parallel beta-helix repeat-containing protein [Phycisphaerae bacterium]|nr:right-handed parallel beta-helix repeat-containing protein [Phycisphaerae bacterium]
MRSTKRSLLARLGAACVAFCAATGIATAQSVRYVDADATGPTHDGLTWCTAYADLQAALDEAGTVPTPPNDPVTEIRVAAGMYKPREGANRTKRFELIDGVAIVGGFAGCGLPDPDQRDFVNHPSILSGDLNGDDLPGFVNDGENSYHVVWALAGVTRSAVLDGFVIEGGNANGNNPSDRGGAIFMFNFGDGSPPSPTIRNCIIRRNRAVTSSATPAKGGAIYIDNGSPLFENCLIVGNHAPDGGAMFNFGPLSMPLIERCTIAHNSADANTGGVYNAGASTIVRNSILWGNSDAGGVDESAQYHAGAGVSEIDYSIVEGWTGAALSGHETIGDNPLFPDADGSDGIYGTADDDFRLSDTSPGVNTGDPASSPAPGTIELANQPRLMGCRVDRGAYETSVGQLFGDFDADEDVDLRDVAWQQICLGAEAFRPELVRACLCLFDDNSDEALNLVDLSALIGAMQP